MSDWELRDPGYLLCVLAAPLAARWMARPGGRVVYSSLELLEGLPHSWRDRLRWWPPLCMAASVICFSWALARPRTPAAETRVHGQGIAMMLVVDRSGSMDARDLVPTDIEQNRLDVVKQVVREFLMGREGTQFRRPNDLVGLVAFAAFADGVCPLTLDHANLVQLLEQIDLASADEDGTAIGDGLGMAVLRLRESKVASKVIVLLTDGENNAGLLDPLQAAKLAKESGIRVHTIGTGTRGFAPVPVRDPYGRIQLVRGRVSIDERSLRRIAQITGGRFFRATDANSLLEIYAEIDQLERTDVSEIRYLQYHEHFGRWLLTGIGFLVLGTISHLLWFRALP